jgi:hypothetical protein
MNSLRPASAIRKWVWFGPPAWIQLLSRVSGRVFLTATRLNVRRFSTLVLILFSTSCNLAATVPSSQSASLWGEIIVLGQAEQMNAPALWIEPERIVATWVSADETGIHQDMRVVESRGSPVAVLPLPPVHPYAQQLAPAQDGRVHLLWLDAGEGGETRLFSALITPQLTVERGPTPLSDRHTFRYTVVPNGDGSLWALWVGEPIAEPVLYGQYVDSLGRPRQPARLMSDADWPAISWTSSGVELYWIQSTTGQVHCARLVNGALDDIQPISIHLLFDSGDRLTGVSAGNDHTHSYLFWNITRAQGQLESWWSTSTSAWSQPQRLGIDWTTKSFIETGFNGGRAFPARVGERWLRWVTPVTGQLDALPVAAVRRDHLGMVYFRGGDVIGYQPIAPITGLIGQPSLLTDRDRHLYLAWSEPTPVGYADLKLTMTRR